MKKEEKKDNTQKARKGKEQGKNRVSIKGVTYEGILKVCDEDKFKELLVTGIGRGKAYGRQKEHASK